MKKILLILTICLLTLTMAGSLMATGGGQGTVVIQPVNVITSQTGIVVSMTLTAGSTAYSSGEIVIDIPTGWSAPSLTTSAPGFVTAVASEGDTLPIAVEGHRITITVATLSATSGTLSVYYGAKSSGGPGAVAPSSAGTSTFSWQTAPDGTGLAVIASEPTIVVSAPTATITPTITITKTVTPTRTVTPTFTATAGATVVKNAGFLAFMADMAGNTTQAVQYYYVKASACAGRLDITGEAQAVFSAGHTLVRKFNSASAYNQNLKRISLILTPSAQATAGALYADTLTLTYTYMLDQAEGHLNYAKKITGTSTTAADKTNVKITIDVDRIAEVRDWITDHL